MKRDQRVANTKTKGAELLIISSLRILPRPLALESTLADIPLLTSTPAAGGPTPAQMTGFFFRAVAFKNVSVRLSLLTSRQSAATNPGEPAVGEGAHGTAEEEKEEEWD